LNVCDRSVWMRFARLVARMSPASRFAVQILAGAAIFVAAAWLFGGIAEDVATQDSLIVFDLSVERWFHAQQSPWWNAFFSIVSRLHEWREVTGATLLFLSYLLYRREWRWVLTLICTVPGGMLLNLLLKAALHRARPTLSALATALHSYSFPSGHVMAATLLYGVTAAYLVVRVAAWQWGVLAVLLACSLVSLVAMSRVFLGVHFLSDVTAAAAAGVMWLALCLVAVHTLWYRLRLR
jgi:membrane-associated phospholipid phosphatase